VCERERVRKERVYREEKERGVDVVERERG
jgi:hypothetical protein